LSIILGFLDFFAKWLKNGKDENNQDLKLEELFVCMNSQIHVFYSLMESIKHGVHECST
jgi:hypothetical protein